MNLKSLKKIKRELLEMLKSPQNRSHRDFIPIATKLGRSEENRGKEPTYTRKLDPHLSPPLSIPKHSGDIKVGTARSIIEALLSDVDAWELYLESLEDDEDEDNDDEDSEG